MSVKYTKEPKKKLPIAKGMGDSTYYFYVGEDNIERKEL